MITFTFEDERDAALALMALNGVAAEMADSCRALPEKSATVKVLNDTRARLWTIISSLEHQMDEQLDREEVEQ